MDKQRGRRRRCREGSEEWRTVSKEGRQRKRKGLRGKIERENGNKEGNKINTGK